MSTSERRLSPAIQIGICLFLIVTLRIYYSWIETQTSTLYPWFADSPIWLFILYFVAVPVFAGLAALAGHRYFSPRMAIPFGAAGGGVVGLVVNSLPGVVIGAVVGLNVYNAPLRNWMFLSLRRFFQVVLPAFLWGILTGCLVNSIPVQQSGSAVGRLALIFTFMVGVLTFVYLAYGVARPDRIQMVQAMVGCLLASLIGMAAAPSVNTLIRVYRLSRVGNVYSNPMPRPALSSLVFWKVYHVSLDGEATDTHLKLLTGLPELEGISLSDAQLSDQALANAFQKLPNLTYLHIENVPIGDEAIKGLSTSRRLMDLQLTGTSISDASFAHLASVRTLRHLTVDGVARRGRGLRELAGRAFLRMLAIRNMAVTDDDLADLAGMPLRILELRNTEVTGSGLHYLGDMPILNSLTIADSPLQDRYLGDLDPQGINWLFIDGVPLTDEGAGAISSMQSLLGLSLTRAGLLDTHVQQFAGLPVTQMVLDGAKLTPAAKPYLVPGDNRLEIDDKDLSGEDIQRLIAIGCDVQLTNCRLDDAALARLSNHSTGPDFVVRSRHLDPATARRLTTPNVRPRTQWVD